MGFGKKMEERAIWCSLTWGVSMLTGAIYEELFVLDGYSVKAINN